MEWVARRVSRRCLEVLRFGTANGITKPVEGLAEG
jgi:hypothetical protein